MGIFKWCSVKWCNGVYGSIKFKVFCLGVILGVICLLLLVDNNIIGVVIFDNNLCFILLIL